MTIERIPLNGKVDFTMMYVAHDAFTRDVHRMAVASERGLAWTPETQAGWAMFTKQLHVHHTTEDTSLWPQLRAQPLRPDEVAILDQMETEHAQIDPELERVDRALAEHDPKRLVDSVHTLAASLMAHMRHEENEALPLIDTHLGPSGWDAFGREIRKTQGGLRGGATYLPWVLDGASLSMQADVLALLPHRRGSCTAGYGRRNTSARLTGVVSRDPSGGGIPRRLLTGAPMTSHCSVVARLPWLDPLPRRQRPIGQRGRTPAARFRGLADSPFAPHHGDIGGADRKRRPVRDVVCRLDLKVMTH
jgi:hypothetical protein